MKQLKLYEYPEAIDRILAEADEKGGELTPAQEAELDSLFVSLPAKVASVVSAIRHAEMLEERCASERERLLAMKGRLTRRTDSLKTYLLRCMAHAEVNRVATELGTISRSANARPSIRWTFSSDPPAEFTRTIIKTELDGAKLYEAWKAGELPEGFEAQLGEHLRIR